MIIATVVLLAVLWLFLRRSKFDFRRSGACAQDRGSRRSSRHFDQPDGALRHVHRRPSPV